MVLCDSWINRSAVLTGSFGLWSKCSDRHYIIRTLSPSRFLLPTPLLSQSLICFFPSSPFIFSDLYLIRTVPLCPLFMLLSASVLWLELFLRKLNENEAVKMKSCLIWTVIVFMHCIYRGYSEVLCRLTQNAIKHKSYKTRNTFNETKHRSPPFFN